MIALPDPARVVDRSGVDPEAFRAERDRLRRQHRVVLGITVGLALLLAVIGVVAHVVRPWSRDAAQFYLVVCVFGVLGVHTLLSRWLDRRQRPVLQRLDRDLVQPVLDSFARGVDQLNGTSGSWLRLGPAEERLVHEVQVVDTGDDCVCDDGMWGVLAGEHVQVGEFRTTEERSSGKSRRTVTLFRGVVLQLRTARPVAAPVWIAPRRRDGFEGALLGVPGDEVRLENVELGDAYTVRAAVPQDAYFVLPHSVQEGLVGLAHRLPQGVGFKTWGDRLLVAVDHQRNVFDIDTSSTASMRHDLARIVTELNESLVAATLLGAWGGRLERPRLLR
ncbi:DUF3137 domain-containing protein [Kytococcus sp. Marseille-QA3725]